MPTEAKAELDRLVGMEYYITDCGGIGGRLRERLEDFVVKEVLLNGVEVDKAKSPRPGPYTWVLIEKRGIDTLSVVSLLRRRLGVSSIDISYGGLKDSNAVATQIISIRGVSASALSGIDLGPRVRVLDAFTMDKPFTPGEIWGNAFTIRVRGPVFDWNLVECVKAQLAERGLPAYYGYQRFGLRRPNSHMIGKYLVLGDFERAVEELLAKPRPTEDPTIRMAREYAARGEYAKALELFPRSIRYLPERAVLRRLIADPGNFGNAISALPLNLLRLYVEAYQSYIFNKALSGRIRRGIPVNRAVEDDVVVLLDEHGLPTRHIMRISRSMLPGVNSLIARGRAAVVGHLVGYNTRFSGVQGEIELGVLREEGVEPDDFRIRHMPKVATGGDVRWLSVNPVIDSIRAEGDSLVFDFKMPKGTYATVLLREFMKPERPEDQL